MKRTLIAMTCWIALIAAPALAGHPSDNPDIVDTAVAAGSFKTLAAALDAAELVDDLKGDGPFTVFAPTDAAFERLPSELLEALLRPANRDRLVQLLTYHVVAGRIESDQALAAGSAKTLQSDTLSIRLQSGRLRVNDARVTDNDITTSNGVIHVIDRVLIPEGFTLARSVETPAEVIELAIERGVPLFNEGQAAACAAIYEVTARSLLALGGPALDDASRRKLERALDRVGSTHDADRQAWILREALDGTYMQLAGKASANRHDMMSRRRSHR